MCYYFSVKFRKNWDVGIKELLAIFLPNPRAATSVATKIGFRPTLKSIKK